LYSLSLITTVGEENLFLLTPFLISQKWINRTPLFSFDNF
jgi:hypothetical protein